MSQAIVDPSDLRRFAQSLKRFNGDLESQLASMRGQLLALGRTWRDQEHQKFAEEFEQTMLVLARFVDSSNQHIPYLLRKADRVEEYLRQR